MIKKNVHWFLSRPLQNKLGKNHENDADTQGWSEGKGGGGKAVAKQAVQVAIKQAMQAETEVLWGKQSIDLLSA